ncbi:DUF6344 domain-containing protein [Streptomyces sp. AK02-01A]|nr:DUF6344 domain-containing protein [Streptomyces sp. AK02-01A]MDX3850429.1 DUF6344 domain-containing protein [Streptomyces sp. AK02-01A]
MAAFKVKHMWTAFITAFFAVLASLGLTAPAAAGGTAVQQPTEQPVPAPAAAEGSEKTTDRAPGAGAPQRGRSLPPTIKQRIHAEAHGSSPSARLLPAGMPSGTGIRGGTSVRSGTATQSGTGMHARSRAHGTAYAADAARRTAAYAARTARTTPYAAGTARRGTAYAAGAALTAV